ncbi:MAG TPA: HlyD family efflux transporter periplasmic adaptor subunit [Polyangiaceae bacterium]|nr:HlyD family efflux transporter periplasmic adaptor subunit [Polyangiaceae bacterium]
MKRRSPGGDRHHIARSHHSSLVNGREMTLRAALFTTLCLVSVAGLAARWQTAGAAPEPSGHKPASSAPEASQSAAAQAAPRAGAAPELAASAFELAAAASEPIVGVLLPRRSTEVAAPVPGTLRELPVRLGDHVEAGAVLASFDVRLSALERQIAEAALETANSEREQLRVQQRQAEQRAQRLQELERAGVAPGSELVDAKFESELGAARVAGADSQVEEQRTRVARLRALEAQSVVRAPFAGTVAARYVDPGATLSVGEPILRLMSDGDAILRFAIPESARVRPAPEQRVSARVRSRPDLCIEAQIERAAPEIDPASRRLIVEARVLAASAAANRALLGASYVVQLLEHCHAEP